MKRSALYRHTPLSRGKPMERGARLKPVNRKRKANAFARNFGERAKVVQALPCIVHVRMHTLLAESNALHAFENGGSMCAGAGWPGRSQAAHARPRGMGGCGGDRRDLIPLCAKHHAEAGEFRTSQRAAFEKRYGLDLVAESRRIAVELDGRGLP